MEDKNKIITSLREQLQRSMSKCSALEQENALLQYELKKTENRVGDSLKIHEVS